MSIPSVVSVQFHIHWVLQAHPGDEAAGGAKLTTDILLMLMLRMCGTLPPVPICFYNVMIKTRQRQFYCREIRCEDDNIQVARNLSDEL
jgi:hypothetical protein